MPRKYVKILDGINTFGGEYGIHRGENGTDTHCIIQLMGKYEPDRALAFQRKEFEYVSKEEYLVSQVLDA